MQSVSLKGVQDHGKSQWGFLKNVFSQSQTTLAEFQIAFEKIAIIEVLPPTTNAHLLGNKIVFAEALGRQFLSNKKRRVG